MGTRHLICVVSDNQYRIAQYGQWDGYPEGQGAAILEFLKSPMAMLLSPILTAMCIKVFLRNIHSSAAIPAPRY